ncbi:MAG: SDR family oxidoreductase [Pseudomonadota bacterium]
MADLIDMWGYKGKRVVINGAATGMGAAATRMLLELGAEVYALDIKEVTQPVKKYIATDLMRKESIDAALEKIPGNIDRVFTCAGIAGPPDPIIDVPIINFVGNRYMVDSLLPRVVEGGAIVMISSAVASGWQQRIDDIRPLLETQGFDEAVAWLEANPDSWEGVAEGYNIAKMCMIAYIKSKAWGLSERKIRINAISPGATDTPMMVDFHAVSKEFVDLSLGPIGRYATPEEQAAPLVFLNSNMASYISGVNLVVDFGVIAEMEINLA